MPALRDNVGMWRGELSGRVSVPNFDSVHKMLGSSSAKRGVCRDWGPRNVESFRRPADLSPANLLAGTLSCSTLGLEPCILEIINFTTLDSVAAQFPFRRTPPSLLFMTTRASRRENAFLLRILSKFAANPLYPHQAPNRRASYLWPMMLKLLQEIAVARHTKRR